MPRRNPFLGVGFGDISVPYDQSGGIMPQGGGMSVPEPGGSMKKMQFEFADPAEQQAQQQQIQMQQAGIPPAGAGGGAPPALPPGQGAPQGGAGSMFGVMAPPTGGMPQGPDSSMLGDDQLAAMLQGGGGGGMDEVNPQGGLDPVALQADQMEQQLANNPDLQMQMMMAARRYGGF
jgi:hypothetical protein